MQNPFPSRGSAPGRGTAINPAIYQQMLESAPNASAKGQAQYFTPLDWARVLALPLPRYRPVIVDLNCGNGQLLQGAASHTAHLLGCDIDPGRPEPRAPGLAPNFVPADITKFSALLREVQFQADLFVLNPPWDLHWPRARLAELADSACSAVADAYANQDDHRQSKKFLPQDSPAGGPGTIDSTIATLCLALDLCTAYGEGYLIANEATLQRLIFAPNAPHGDLQRHVWAHLIIPGNICSPEPKAPSPEPAFQTGVIYFARSPQSGSPVEFLIEASAARTALAQATQLCEGLRRDRLRLRRGAEVAKDRGYAEDTRIAWAAAKEEWERVTATAAKPIWNIYMDGPVIRTNLSLFDEHSGRIPKGEVQRLFALNDKTPMSLVVQKAHREELMRAAGLLPHALGLAPQAPPWRVAPAVVDAVRLAIREYEAMRAPLKPLNAIQRLGYLDEHETIECCQDLAPAFQKGRSYKLRTLTISVRRDGTKMNLSGGLDQVQWAGSELAIYVTAGEKEYLFMEGRNRDKSVFLSLNPDSDDEADRITIDFTLHQLVSHFIIPEVPDVATQNPSLYQRLIADLHQIEQLVA